MPRLSLRARNDDQHVHEALRYVGQPQADGSSHLVITRPVVQAVLSHDDDALDFLTEALAVAHARGRCGRTIIHARYVASDFSVDAKADVTPVTEADRDAEMAIKDVLRASFPDHAFR